jgi:type II secretory pathway pseudopilin PulG
MAGPPAFEQNAEEANMIRRSGTTLIEVLVAIFVTAIGLLGLLALFPLGAVNMALAIKDSRCAQAAANAFALAQAMNIRNDPVVVGGPPGDIFVDAVNGRPPANPNGPSFPVYVDPLGWSNGMPPYLGALGGHGSPGIPRRNVSFVSSAPNSRSLATAVQWFSLLDDITFIKDGQYTGLPCQPTLVPSHGGSAVVQPGNLQSEGRYTWAYLLRRPRSSEKSVVDLTVVVYSGRPTVFGQGENSYSPVIFDPNSRVVRVYWTAGQEKPPVRTGGWILDATMVRSPSGIATQVPQADPHGFFYRVVNVTDGNDGKPYVDLELQTNPKAPTTQGVLVVLDGVAEVFEKGPGWRP